MARCWSCSNSSPTPSRSSRSGVAAYELMVITRAPARMNSTCRSRTSCGSSIRTRPDQSGVGGVCERRSSSWPMPPSVRVISAHAPMLPARGESCRGARNAGTTGCVARRVRQQRIRAEPATSLLHTPITLRDVEFRNRAWVSPMCQYSSLDGVPDRLAPRAPRCARDGRRGRRDRRGERRRARGPHQPGRLGHLVG